MKSPTSTGESARHGKRSADSKASTYLRERGIAGVIQLAHASYQRYQASHARRGILPGIVENTEAAIWGSLLASEFRATGEESDSDVGVSGILPVRALMAARMADQDFESLTHARELLQGTPLQQQVLDSLTERWTMSSIVSLNTTPEGAIVIYTASSLALNNEPHPYLQKLAGALQLPAGLVKSVHDQTTEQLSCQRI
ncbi:MAG: DUF533 domain-containing protein [Pseudomonadota bacterium]